MARTGGGNRPGSGAPGEAAASPGGGDQHKAATPPPDLPSLLLESRIVYLGMPLVSAVTELIVAELLYLQYRDASKDLFMYINSTGTTRADGETVGFETEGMAILDTMCYMKVRFDIRRIYIIYHREGWGVGGSGGRGEYISISINHSVRACVLLVRMLSTTMIRFDPHVTSLPSFDPSFYHIPYIISSPLSALFPTLSSSLLFSSLLFFYPRTTSVRWVWGSPLVTRRC